MVVYRCIKTNFLILLMRLRMFFATPKTLNLCIPCYIKDVSQCWEKILHLGRKELHNKNTIFIGSEYGNDRFFYLKSGKFCTFNYVNGIEKLHFIFDRATLCRESIFVSPFNLRQNFYYKCISDVELYTFDKKILFDKNFYIKYPELVMNCMLSISIKNIMCQVFTNVVTMKNKEKQIAFYIYSFYKYGHSKKVVVPPLSQSQLAGLLGIHKITMSRIIGNWKRDGLIGCYTKTRLEILDIDAIQAMTEE